MGSIFEKVQSYFKKGREAGSFQEFLGLTAALCVEHKDSLQDIWQECLKLILRNWNSGFEYGLYYWQATEILLAATQLDSYSLYNPNVSRNHDFWLQMPQEVEVLPEQMQILTKVYMMTIGVFETINYNLYYEAPVSVTYSKESLCDLLKHGSIHIEWGDYLTDSVLNSLTQYVMRNTRYHTEERAKRELFKLPFVPVMMKIGIQEYSIYDDVEILGHTFVGLEDIKRHVELSLYEGCSTTDIKNGYKLENVHIGEMWAPYPCFDSSDSLYENRTYQNYIFRNRPITPEDLQNLHKLPIKDNHSRLSEKVPSDMLPMVYYNGDDDTMLVLTNT